MTNQERPGLLKALLLPRAFLTGTVCSFLVLCLTGHLVSRYNIYSSFHRFHQVINTETLYFPTARQVQALSREKLPPDKVAVIVGGNSVLMGTGQRAEHLWTEQLQQELGDQYRVINLAVRGAFAHEFGAVMAEVLSREHNRVILLSCVSSSGVAAPEIDGNEYRYFFWDAYHRGLLLNDPVREEHLSVLRQKRGPDFAELERQMQADCITASRDLWTAVGYEYCSTAWVPNMLGLRFAKPRKKYPDPEPGLLLPHELRFPPEHRAESLKIMRNWIAYRPMVENGHAPAIERLAVAIPEPDRRRTLLVAVPDNPYYVNQLASHEQALYREVFTVALGSLREAGFATLEVGRDYTEEDFADRCHLSEPGGRRLCGDVAPKVRELARSLGYLKGERKPHLSPAERPQPQPAKPETQAR
jgi:hypothetical protein